MGLQPDSISENSSTKLLCKTEKLYSTKMMKIIFLTVAFIATVSACSDASSRCRFFPTSMCSNVIMKMRCKAKCGLCGTGACSDASKYCPMFQGKCDNPLVKAKCQNMCNACEDSGAGGNGGPCADE